MQRACKLFYNKQGIKFYIDQQVEREIQEFLEQDDGKHLRKLHRYFDLVDAGQAPKTVYSKESAGKQFLRCSAFKFKGKSSGNARIYCLDQMDPNGCRIIIMCALHYKKQKKLTHKEISILSRVNGYEY